MITMWNVTRFKAHQLESHKRTKPLSRQGVVCSNRTTTRYSGGSLTENGVNNGDEQIPLFIFREIT